MTAPIAAHAKVSATGAVATLGAKAAPDAVVRAEDVQDATKLARMLEGLLSGVAALKARWAPRKLDYEDVTVGSAGALTRLAHGIAGRVRWSVVGWKTTATATTNVMFGSSLLWLQRGFSSAVTLASTAGNFTTGVRFRATSPTLVIGGRFLWKAATKTVKCTLWRDSDGVVLGSGTATCTDTGAYSVTFAAPVLLSGADLNVDLTIGIYDVSGGVFTNTGVDAVWQGYLPMTLPGLSLRTNQLFLAGDNRPTTTAGGGLNWIEPILAPAVPSLVENAATDANNLVLASYSPGTATIRVESAG